MYKTDKDMQNAGIVVSSVEEEFVSFFVCVPEIRGRGVRSARHSIIEHGFACKAPAISERYQKRYQKKSKINKTKLLLL